MGNQIVPIPTLVYKVRGPMRRSPWDIFVPSPAEYGAPSSGNRI